MISRKQLKINSFLLLILSIIYFIALNIKSASAADGSINVSLLTNDVEFLLENVNAILAVGVAIVAFYLTKSLKGSPMAKGWNIIVIGVIMFAILEVYNVNRGLGFLHVSGLGDILEFLTILFLLVGFVTIYRSYK